MRSGSSAGEGFGLSIIPKFALYREDYQVTHNPPGCVLSPRYTGIQSRGLILPMGPRLSAWV